MFWTKKRKGKKFLSWENVKALKNQFVFVWAETSHTNKNLISQFTLFCLLISSKRQNQNHSSSSHGCHQHNPRILITFSSPHSSILQSLFFSPSPFLFPRRLFQQQQPPPSPIRLLLHQSSIESLDSCFRREESCCSPQRYFRCRRSCYFDPRWFRSVSLKISNFLHEFLLIDLMGMIRSLLVFTLLQYLIFDFFKVSDFLCLICFISDFRILQSFRLFLFNLLNFVWVTFVSVWFSLLIKKVISFSL